MIALRDGDVDGGQQRVVLVGDEHGLPVRAHAKLLGIGTGGQVADDLQGLRVDDLDRVVVAGADEEKRSSFDSATPRGR